MARVPIKFGALMGSMSVAQGILDLHNQSVAPPMTRELGPIVSPKAPAAKTARKSLSSRTYGVLKGIIHSADTRSKLHDRVTFDDRRAGFPVMVCMLAGYKANLWPLVMPRFKAALPDADVCLVSPGMRSEALAELCRKEGWSYLSTATNDVSLAQNVCFRLHDKAEMIVKLDEDMVLPPNTITELVGEYKRIKAEGKVDPGFVAPMIPLNGFCYRELLEMLGILDEYESLFGTARLGTSGLAIHTDPAAARWIWERASPLAVGARLGGMPVQHLLCPIQFSIGLIVFERAFWRSMGHFTVHRHKLLAGMSTLGGDEACICAATMLMSRPIVVTTAAVAGHFSFGPQYKEMLELHRTEPGMFTL